MDGEMERDPVEVRQERWASLLEGESVHELRVLPREQVIAKHDALVDEANRSKKPGPAAKLQWWGRAQVYADELVRRDTENLTKSLNRLTGWIVGLTVIIAIATIVGVFLAWAGLCARPWWRFWRSISFVCACEGQARSPSGPLPHPDR